MASKRLIWKDEFGATHSTEEKINGKFVGNKDIQAKLYEYEQEESEGRLIHLPCKVGETVYYLATKYEKQGRRKVAIDIVEKGIVDSIILGQTMIPQIVVCNKDNIWTTFDSKSDFGKIVFLSPDQAEQALKESEQE